MRLVEEHGAKKWSLIASHLPGRIGKQCRERFARPSSALSRSPIYHLLSARFAHFFLFGAFLVPFEATRAVEPPTNFLLHLSPSFLASQYPSIALFFSIFSPIFPFFLVPCSPLLPVALDCLLIVPASSFSRSFPTNFVITAFIFLPSLPLPVPSDRFYSYVPSFRSSPGLPRRLTLA